MIQSNTTYTGETFVDLQIVGVENVTFEDCTFLSSSQAYRNFCDVRNSKGITFKGGRIGANSDAFDIYGLMVRNSQGVTIEGMEIADVRYGLLATGCDGVTIAHNRFHDLRTDGMQIQSSSNVTIEDNDFRDFRPAVGNHPDAIQIYNKTTTPMTGIVVRRNWIERGDGGVMQGIFVRSYEGMATVDGLLIEDNAVLGAMMNGISAHSDAKIRGNTVIGYIGQNSYIMADGTRCTIEGNRATGYSINRNPKTPIPLGNDLLKLMEPAAALALLKPAPVELTIEQRMARVEAMLGL